MRIIQPNPFTAAIALFCALTVLAQAPATPPPQPPTSAPQVQPATPPPAADSQPVGKERFQGTIVNQGGMGSRAFLAGLFTVEIDQYTSDQETLALALALKNGEQKGLLDKIWKMKQIGFLKVGGSMGFPLFVARSKETPGGRLIRCVTNRPIAPSELNMGSKRFGLAILAMLVIAIPVVLIGQAGAASVGRDCRHFDFRACPALLAAYESDGAFS